MDLKKNTGLSSILSETSVALNGRISPSPIRYENEDISASRESRAVSFSNVSIVSSETRSNFNITLNNLQNYSNILSENSHLNDKTKRKNNDATGSDCSNGSKRTKINDMDWIVFERSYFLN